MDQEQKSAIFGLNFLQEMKGDSTPIDGAYDPEQGLWISEGQVRADGTAGSTISYTGGAIVQTSHPGYGVTIDSQNVDTSYDVRSD